MFGSARQTVDKALFGATPARDHFNERRYLRASTKRRVPPHLGAGRPEETLSLPDNGTNIRFFMLDPLDASPWRARWHKGEMDESGEITAYPPVHPTQAEGAWAGFFLPLVPLVAKIAKGILVAQLHKERSEEDQTWVRFRHTGPLRASRDSQ